MDRPAVASAEQTVVQFFGRAPADLPWLVAPAAQLTDARDHAISATQRLRAVAELMLLLDQIYAEHLPALSDHASQDDEAASMLSAVTTGLPSYVEYLLDAVSDQLTNEALSMEDGLRAMRMDDLPATQIEQMYEYYMHQVYPLLIPLAVDPGHPFPFISSGSINLLVELQRPVSARPEPGHRLFARVKIPSSTPDRISLSEKVSQPLTGPISKNDPFVWCGDLVRYFVDTLFSGMQIKQVYLFRLLRGGASMQGIARSAPERPVVRLDVDRSMPQPVLQWLTRHLGVAPHGVVRSNLVLELAYFPRFHLHQSKLETLEPSAVSNRIRSIVFVAVQFLCLALIALSGSIIAQTPHLLLLEIAGCLLGLWAIVSMRIGNFNVTPDVRADGRFVASGPYRFIRHPMYAALLLVTLVLVVDDFTWWRAAIWLVLAADLVLKLRYEESLLLASFPQYASYVEQTKRLIPWVL